MIKTFDTDDQGRRLQNPDGSARMRYTLTEEERDAGFVAYAPGAVSGLIELPTGAVYDVTEFCILVHEGHVQALHRAVHEENHRRGRFLDAPVPD